MTTYRLKRKTFSDNNQEMSTGTKVVLGLGSLATLAGAGYGASKGMFGTGAQRWMGKNMVRFGARNSGVEAIAKADTKDMVKFLEKRNPGTKFTQEQVDNLYKKKVANVNRHIDQAEALKDANAAKRMSS